MLARIESADNNKLKLVRKLANKKTRDEEGKFVVEGFNLVEEAVNKNADIDYILISDDCDASRLANLRNSEIPLYEVPEVLFNRLTDAENGVGVVAVVRKTKNALCVDADKNVLVLDRVQDPGNIGTMIRTAVAAGYGSIIAIKGTADLYSAKVLRATAGMIFDIPLLCVDDAAELRAVLEQSKHRIAVTVPTGGRAYYEEYLKTGIALVIGNEGNGISQELLEIADVKLTIPMCGDIESLNAAVSAAILMYETIRS